MDTVFLALDVAGEAGAWGSRSSLNGAAKDGLGSNEATCVGSGEVGLELRWILGTRWVGNGIFLSIEFNA